MKHILLTNNKYAIVDDEDYGELSKYKWSYHQGRAIRNIRIGNKRSTILMHRQLLCGINPDEFNVKTGWVNVATRGRMKSGKYMSEWKYNGIDRVNPNKGYTSENVVSCCGICNHAKHTMSYEDFIDWLDRIANFRTLSKD